MKGKRWVLLGIVVAALATMAGAVVMAGPAGQGPEPQGDVGAQAGVGISASTALSTSFTYQGHLESGGEAVSDDCQMAFHLYDAESGGVEVGSAITRTVPISDGLFTVDLDFGAGAFAGDARWLGIKVLCPGDAGYADLGRQALSAAPYAHYALSAGALQGYPVTMTVPSGGQALKWDGSAWAPAADADTTYTAGVGLVLSGTTFTVVTDTVQARVSEVCAEGSTVRAVNADGSVVCWADADTTYAAGAGLTLSGTTFTVVTDTVQARVSEACAEGSTVRAINADGSVVCWDDADTTYTAGAGLILSGTTFTVVTDTVQARVGEACAGGSTIQAINADGSVVCQASTGTTYAAGAGLVLSGTTFSVLTDTVQARVVGACAVGSTIQAINADGSVVCQVDAPLNRPLAPADNVSTTLDAAGSVGWYTSVTIGADGLPLISYHDATNDDLKVAHCNDLACTSATLTTVDAGDGVGEYTSVTIGADGLPLISYYERGFIVLQRDSAVRVISSARSESGNLLFAPYAEIPRLPLVARNDVRGQSQFVVIGSLKVAHCNDLACTSATVTTVDDGGARGNVGRYTSVTIGADGLPLIGYYDLTNTNLKVAHCNDLACTSAISTTVDSVGDVGWGASVTIGADGLPLISYFDQSNADLKVAHCDDVACTTATVTTVDAEGYVGAYASVAIGADGLPLISYFDGPNTALKVAHCDDVVCTSAISTTVDTGGAGGEVGLFTSVTIGADGLPLISYYDNGFNRHLKVAHCADLACTSASSVTVDATWAVGWFTSVTIGVDGLPLISYYDDLNDDLKVMHCSNPFCVPYWRRR
jgi:hypothetical protein